MAGSADPEIWKKRKIEEAVDQAINELPENFETRTFLVGHRAEVKSMCITEYNEAETMQMFKEQGELDRACEMAERMIRATRSYYIPTLKKVTWIGWQEK